MSLDVLTIGEALVEVMRTDVDQPLDRPGPFVGPYPSGAPFIFAVQCARLGMRAAAIGSVGRDAFGACLLGQLQADGVETSGLRQLDDYTTGVAFVAYQADGSRSFVFSLGAGGQLSPEMLQAELFEHLRCFHVMGSTLSMSQAALEVCLLALSLALQQGALISFDPNLRPELLPPAQARAAFQPFIEAADILLPTEAELLLLTDEPSLERAVSQLLGQRPKRMIVVTRGDAGCSVFTAAGRVDVAGYAVAEVDPTGAGDCFDAGFLAAILKGRTAVEAARFANACGALAVSEKGPMAGVKGQSEIERFMRTAK